MSLVDQLTHQRETTTIAVSTRVGRLGRQLFRGGHVPGELIITVEDDDRAEANMLREDLRESLIQDMPGVVIDRLKSDQITQDFGAGLALILATPAVAAFAKGIFDWLAARHRGCKLKLKKKLPDGTTKELVVEGPPSARTQKIVTAFLDEN